ncbi:DHH family phosphoesterase [Thermococcus argininiproducens]|uniref:DHH family phosphoesterase n=1 Tax=Thermococcus argininiproducens TaxID=2866384 RepID=A0A9E7MAY4_9EURY|nr:DHH family phosphoesterase [Thermococcus argininiproducens]USH00434.1 DHH family phosphoesterase [Thermococcus argininiproducens]
MLIIHHWDTDGITSAALLVKALNLVEFKNMSPPIGEFRFDERIKRAIERSEEIYILDLNLPHEVEGINKSIVFIDHHIQPRIRNPKVKQINPALEGEEAPSASFVVSQYFNFWNTWSALGVIGDIGEKAFEIPKVGELLEREGFTKEEALRLVELMDSNYITTERKSVEKAVKVVLETPVRDLLTYGPWVKKAEAIGEAINGALAGAEVRDGMAFITFKSPFNIISKVARKAVWEIGYEGAVVVNEDFHGKAQIYFRISSKMAKKINMGEIISELKGKGFNAGGKREVLGCICEKDKIEEVLRIINAHLG